MTTTTALGRRVTMAYLRNYESDVFVSYAHLDNEAEEGQLGWVDRLVQKLERELRQRLGTTDVKVWMDHALAGNVPLTPELLRRISRSALLLLIMSPGYLNSEWCRRERAAFLSMVKDRVASGAVFVVHLQDLERAQIPVELSDLIGHRFWVRDREAGTDRPLGVANPNEPSYLDSIFRLSHELKEQLQMMKGPAARVTPTSLPIRVDGGADARPVVFLAEGTEDLEDRETELRSCLTQMGLRVASYAVHAASG